MAAARGLRKYHALGNDYLVVTDGGTATTAEVRAWCNRHQGLGADGVLLPGAQPERVTIFNPDGSVAESSGNGARIYARYLFDAQHVHGGACRIVTSAGRELAAHVYEGGRRVSVDMGVAVRLDPVPVPFSPPLPDTVLAQRVHVGNPHLVVFAEDVSEEVCRRWGPLLEVDARFPERTNVQFVKVLNRQLISVQVWERGAGWTRASGSSACAVQVACLGAGFTDAQATVRMPGGDVTVTCAPDGRVTQEGPVVHVYDITVAMGV